MDAILSAPIGALFIFSLRVVDVSMSIMRMILAVRGHRIVAAGIGFFEVLVWLFAVGTALKHLDSWLHLVGYAGGFATGNYVGVWLESRFPLGTSIVRAVLRRTDGGTGEEAGHRAAQVLRTAGYAVTEVGGRGQDGDVVILIVVVPRRQVDDVLALVKVCAPEAFLTVEEVRRMHGGYVRPAGRKLPFLSWR